MSITEKNEKQMPLRVDFAGGWLDVPELAREDGYVVNCAISPLVSKEQWPYHIKSGLGGSGAWALLNDKDGVAEELKNGAGWQDPAIIEETGLCVWKSGAKPNLDTKETPSILEGRMALLWTGNDHDTPTIKKNERDYDGIVAASKIARSAVLEKDISLLAKAVNMTYGSQLGENMKALPSIQNEMARKYCGSGHGGYAVYLYAHKNQRDQAVLSSENMISIEPYTRR